MNKVTLFDRTGNIDDVKRLRSDMIASKLFKDPRESKGVTAKKALTDKSNLEKDDVCIAVSNVSDFITVWARHERKGKNAEPASYGIRVKCVTAEAISALKLLVGNAISFNDTSEYRINCYSIDDVKFFTAKVLQYLQQHSINRKTKEVATVESVTA